ncbi:MAG: ATP-dependent helicase [Candidatus Dormibacteraeota bacterium]|nr:ATP-dependent helicase [Candidatus Dormibacteraeota bacterium]
MPLPLSAEQRAACAELEGPVRVLAGAGTGKTTVIVERFCRLRQSGVPDASILVMTFTERAAAEMQQRIEARTGRVPPAVGTFHALALRWLQETGSDGLRPGFRILTGADRWIALRELMWEVGNPALVGVERPDDLVGPLLQLQERLKQELVPLRRLRAWAADREDPEEGALYLAAAQLFQIADRRARQRNQADFDDLLLRCVRLLERDTGAREAFRRRYPWILVDEYQDTNTAQERLVELLGAPDGNVTVVGDDDQSIYRFRGASRASMERFLQRFPGARTLTLGSNRRSALPIVSVARAVIEQDDDRFPKPIVPGRVDGDAGPVELRHYPDGADEAAGVAAELVAAHRAGHRWSDLAVLVRTHGIARPLLEALSAAQVPYVHRGGGGLYLRPEVRDMVAYLRLVQDPGDLHALARITARPPLKLDLISVFAYLRAEDEGGGDALGPLHRLGKWPPTADWAGALLEVVPDRDRLGVEDLLFRVMEASGHLDHLVREAGPEEAQRILAAVDRFAELVADFSARHQDQSLRAFLEHLDLVLLSGIDEPLPPTASEDAVQVLSIHQAKGLEFHTVLVPALVEGRLPHSRRGTGIELPAALVEAPVRGREDHVAEERRLLYVGLTRARERLVLSRAERYEGSRSWRPSRFLDGIPVLDREIPPASEPPRAPAGEQPLPAAPRPRLSYSAITTYRECPRQYWYRYRLRLEAPPTVEAQLGSVVHRVLEGAGHLRSRGECLTPERLRSLYDEAWADRVPADRRRHAVMRALGWDLLRRAHERGDLEPAPVYVESRFETDLEGWSLRGYIDRVEKVGDGWRIVDFKTGRPLSTTELRRDLQLALYALGARRGLGLHGPLALQIAYLRRGERVEIPVDGGLLRRAERIGEEVARGILAGDFQARPLPRRCALCAYRMTCPDAL